MPDLQELKPGTKVRLVIEGFTAHDGLRRGVLYRERGGGLQVVHLGGAEGWAEVEVLEQARPVWWPPKDGDTVLLEGLPKTRRAGCWWGPSGDTLLQHSDDDMTGAYLLARDGVPYQQYGQHTE